VGVLRKRLDRLERKHADPSGAAAATIDERMKRQDTRPSPSLNPADPVGEVLRLQFRAPCRLLDGLHEREEQLRRRPFRDVIIPTPAVPHKETPPATAP
jgi:hypothetical protein